MSAPVRQALRAFLLANATISGLVGTRVRPVVLAQGTALPGISYRKATAGRRPAMRGDDDLPAPQFEITVWAADIDQAVAVANAVREAMETQGDTAGGDVWPTPGDDVTVTSVTLLDEADTYDDETGGEGEIRFGVRQLYEICHEEP